MLEPDIEISEFVEKGINAADQTCDRILEEIKGVLETRNAPMVNRLLIRLKLTLDGIYEVYFSSTPDINIEAMREHVKHNFPHIA